MTLRKDLLLQTKKTFVLESVPKLINEKGDENTTIGDLAKASDYPPATIYKLCRSKECGGPVYAPGASPGKR